MSGRAQKLADLGYDVVSVVPPGAPISERSRIDPSQRGKCPGVKGPDGTWSGYDFTKKVVRPEWIDGSGANVGVMGDRFPALDIDSESEALTRVVLARAIKELGPSPVRLSRGARRLLMYRTDSPFRRIALDIWYEDERHTLEFLGEKRQYLVAGTHPAGPEYRWDETAPWDINPADLPEITEEQARTFLTRLRDDLRGKGIEADFQGAASKSTEPAPPQENLRAPSLEQLADVVSRIENDGRFAEREDYVRFGHAVKAAGGDEALYIFREWCDRWEDGSNDPETVEADWGRMRPPFRIGWKYLLELAGDAAEAAAQVFELEEAPEGYTPPPPATVVRVSLTDEYHVDRVLPAVEDRLRYVPGTGWFVRPGHVWLEDRDMTTEREIREVLRSMALGYQSMAHAASADEGKKYHAAARRVQSSSGIQAVESLARARLAVDRAAFDDDRWLLNTPSEVIDLRTGTSRAHAPGDMFIRSTAVAPASTYDPALAPHWEAFLEHLTGGDRELRGFVQRYLGYCLTGSMGEKKLVFAWGSDHDTGKSTLVRTATAVMGTYADTVAVDSFIGQAANRYNLARLPGVRLVTATEPAAGAKWDDELVKAITGGDRIEARGIYEAPVTFDPQFKLLIAGNHEPELKNIDAAMLSRVLIVPFNNQVAEEDRDPHLTEKMVQGEGAQVLRWMIEGCAAWRREGLNPPLSVQRATDAYRSSEDRLARWVEENCELGPEYETPRRALYDDYAAWSRRGGMNGVGDEVQFKRTLDARASQWGLEEARLRTDSGRPRGYKGIRLRPSRHDPEEVFDV